MSPEFKTMNRTLPNDSDDRKEIPLFRGCLKYFPAALAGVARWSKLGNDKHNPGEGLHHSRGKSNDHSDCIMRHLLDIGDLTAFYGRNNHLEGEAADDVERQILDEADALAWRALALSQLLHERFGGAPLAPAAREPAKEPAK